MAAKKGFRIKSLLPPLIVIGALGWLSTLEVELPDVFVQEQIIELRDRFYDVVVPNEQVVWAVGKSGKIVRSDDRGETFYVQSTPTEAHLQSIAAWDDQHAVVIGNDGLTLNTVDGGVTWEPVDAPLGEVAKKMFRTEIGPNGRVWATAEFGSILYSDDRGLSWTRVGGDQDVAWNDVGFAKPDQVCVDEEIEQPSCSDDENGAGCAGDEVEQRSCSDGPVDRVCVVGEFGQLGCSDDQGETWLAKETPLDSSLMGIAFSDDLNGLAVGLDGHVIQTADAGETWTAVNSPTGKHLFGLDWVDGVWVIVGEKGTFLQFDPIKSTWIEENLGSKGNVWYTGVQSGHGGIYISGQALGIWKDGELHQFGR